MKGFLFVFLIITMAFCRENPFFPVNSSDELSYTTNKVKKYQSFHSQAISLPNTARILQSVIVEYKNLDGSISQKRVDIQKAIDWHQPLMIEQGNSDNNQSCTIQPMIEKPFQEIGSTKFIAFYYRNMELKIATTDRLLRHFILIKPDRIVLDFKRDIDFRTKSFFSKKIFKKITIGNHSGYYRVVIQLDGKYIYKIKKEKDSYIITLS